LQVHHIIEKNQGGTDDLDNLIAICVSCHSDVHTETKLTRRFTTKELKLHRDNVYLLVADGKLPSGGETDDTLHNLSAAIIQRLLSTMPPQQVTRPALSPEAVEVLLAAVSENAPINVVRYDGGMSFCTGGMSFGGGVEVMALGVAAVGRRATQPRHSRLTCDDIDGRCDCAGVKSGHQANCRSRAAPNRPFGHGAGVEQNTQRAAISLYPAAGSR
jgi:hypothetical protein